MSDLASIRTHELNDGKSLSLAVGLAAVGAGLIFLLARAFFISEDFVGSIYENGVPRALAGFFLLLVPYIHQRLAGKRRLSLSHQPDAVVPFESYSLPWSILLLYSVLITFAIAGIGLFLVWLVGLASGFFLTRAISIQNIIILFITFYYLGTWIGSRSARRPYLTAAGMVVGYAILEGLVAVVLEIDSPFRSLFAGAGIIILSLIAALVGAFIGKRRRLLSYIRFLLGPISEPNRLTLVDHLYREVNQQIVKDAENPARRADQ